MAAMTTALTEFSDKEDLRVFVEAGHTVQKPQMVIQKRKRASSVEGTAESTITVSHGCEDSNGDLLAGKIAFIVTVRTPVQAIAADVTAAETVFKDIVASDEFMTVVDTQKYLK